jgi:hypothetical protein
MSRIAGALRDAVRIGELVAPKRLGADLSAVVSRRDSEVAHLADSSPRWLVPSRRGGTVSDSAAYDNWRSLALAIKEASKRTSREAGAGISAATVDTQIRHARYDRLLSRVFVHGRPRDGCARAG